MERMRIILAAIVLLFNSTGCKTLPTKAASQLSAEEEEKAGDKEKSAWPRLGTYSARTITGTKIGSKPATVSSLGSMPATLRLMENKTKTGLTLTGGGLGYFGNGESAIKDSQLEKSCPRQEDPAKCKCSSYAKTIWQNKGKPSDSAVQDRRRLLQIEDSVVETLVTTGDKTGKATYSYKKQNCKALVGRTDAFMDTTADKEDPDYLFVNEISICLTDDGQLAKFGQQTKKTYTCEKKNDAYIDELPKLYITRTTYIDAIEKRPSWPDLHEYTAEIVFDESDQPVKNAPGASQKKDSQVAAAAKPVQDPKVIKFSIEMKAREGDQKIIKFVKWGGPGFPAPGKDYMELTDGKMYKYGLTVFWSDTDWKPGGNRLVISFKTGRNGSIVGGVGTIEKNGVERRFFLKKVKVNTP